jgi:RNA polymerase sigma-70 factor (ECF subfamily)
MAARNEEFTRIYDDEVWHVYGFFGYRVGSRELAEDLTQTTFERALRAWSRFDPARASARTWLLSIARNLLIDHFRRQGATRTEPLLEGEAGEVQVGGSEAEPRVGISPELEVALTTLGGRERELIALRYGGDLSGPEIAEITGLSLPNVQQILSRSLRRLRLEIEIQARRGGAERLAPSRDTRNHAGESR